MTRGWQTKVGTTQSVGSLCPLSNGLTSKEWTVDAKYRWNNPSLPTRLDPIATPALRVRHIGASQHIDFSTAASREAIVTLAKRGDWHL
jgi:hypothetical protein